MSKMRILVVEDEPKVAGALREGLQAEGFDVALAGSGEEAFLLANTESFDLLLLDRMLPGRDGLEVLRTLRRQGFLVPVLMLTARDAVSDRVAGLDAGADDYLVKPFAFPELLARIRAIARRGRGEQDLLITVSDLTIDVATRRCSRGGRELDLTPREYALLEYLARHRGVLVSREMLGREVWREPSRATPLDNVIDVHVAHLRKKVDHGFPTKLIHTVRGVGFLLGERATGGDGT